MRTWELQLRGFSSVGWRSTIKRVSELMLRSSVATKMPSLAFFGSRTDVGTTFGKGLRKGLKLSQLATLVLLAAPITPTIAGESERLCNEFRRLLDTPLPNGVGAYQLEKAIPIGGSERDARYFNVDIDGDDISDFVEVSCPGSTRMPADPCRLMVELSSGKRIEFEKERFFLVRLHSRIYAVANHAGAGVNTGKRSIYLIDRRGTSAVCPKL